MCGLFVSVNITSVSKYFATVVTFECLEAPLSVCLMHFKVALFCLFLYFQIYQLHHELLHSVQWSAQRKQIYLGTEGSQSALLGPPLSSCCHFQEIAKKSSSSTSQAYLYIFSLERKPKNYRKAFQALNAELLLLYITIWILCLWVNKSPFWVNVFPQAPHRNGFSFKWTAFLCWVRFCLTEKDFSQ